MSKKDQSEQQPALRLLEATLFASAEPAPLEALQAQIKGADVPALLKELQAHY